MSYLISYTYHAKNYLKDEHGREEENDLYLSCVYNLEKANNINLDSKTESVRRKRQEFIVSSGVDESYSRYSDEKTTDTRKFLELANEYIVNDTDNEPTST